MLILAAMFRLMISSVSTLSMLASALLLWQSDFFPEKLPNPWPWGPGLFQPVPGPFRGHDPVRLHRGGGDGKLVHHRTPARLPVLHWWPGPGLLCLVGFLSVHYPPIQQYFQALAGNA